MVVPDSLDAFLDNLTAWMATCVTSRTIDPQTKQPYNREDDLVNDALEDAKAIFAWTQSNPQALGKVHRIHATFFWGRLYNGYWYVRKVAFSTQGFILPEPPEPPDPPVPPPFKIDDTQIDHFPTDVDNGRKIVEHVKDIVYQQARKEAKLVVNPISTPSLKDLGKTGKEVAKGGDIPGVEMGKMAIGSMLQAFINSQAGDVAAVRRQAYAWFIEGFLQVIAWKHTKPPSTAFQKKYYELGQQTARQYSPHEQYQIQLYLLNYASQNPSSGWKIPQPQDWSFPDEYQRHWSPELMGEALFNQLYATKYSVGSDFEAKNATAQ